MSVAYAALDELLALAKRARPDFLTIDEQAPALRTRFYADEAAAAAIAAGATLAADIWMQRTGETQSVNVATRQAAASLISFAFQQFEDETKAPMRAGAADAAGTAANGFVRAKDDRFVYLHPSFPPTTKKLLEMLDCEDTNEAVAARVAEMNAQTWEDVIAATGICGAKCRSPEEWDDSLQGRRLARTDIVEVHKLGESPPQPFPSSGDAPLAGLRVLDLTRVLAGPACARALAQYGADVLHIAGPDLPSVPYFVSDTGHGKRSAFIDLKTESGAARLRDLLRETDVFSQGYRTGAMRRLGFGPAELAKLRPGIIAVEINCYGHDGPWKSRPGWEQLAQTVTGMAHMHGGANSPALQPAAVCDYTTGYLAAYGVLMALMRRAREGGSYVVRASLCRTAMWVRGLGYADESRLAAVEQPGSDELARYSTHTETGFGPLRHLAPPVTLSRTPARWARPTVPLGTHDPSW